MKPVTDFQMFGPMKEALRGRKLLSDEVTGAVQNWLKTQPKIFFFFDGIIKLVKRRNRCVEVDVDYVEK
jgi:hypothetical protein